MLGEKKRKVLEDISQAVGPSMGLDHLCLLIVTHDNPSPYPSTETRRKGAISPSCDDSHVLEKDIPEL